MPSFIATITEVRDEGPATRTLWLDPGEPVEYRAGQFISIDPFAIDTVRPRAHELEALKGRKERPRAYSLASAPHEPLLAICVKEEPAGAYPSLLSPHLAQAARIGDRLACTGFNGFYNVPDDLPPGTHVVHLCAGSGIVPNFAIAKDLLHRGVDVRQTLLVSNRVWDEAIYRDELARLEAVHPDRLRLVHTLTRSAAPDAALRRGRIDAALLQGEVADLAAALFLVCGPSIPEHERRAARLKGRTPAPRFLESMKRLLTDLGVPKERIRTEGW